jgi:hypothetical protein
LGLKQKKKTVVVGGRLSSSFKQLAELPIMDGAPQNMLQFYFG